MSNVAVKPRRTWRQALLWRLQWTWICLTWYVLSIGPMFWTWHHATVHGDNWPVEVFYLPLALACEFPPIGRLVNAYIELWVM